MITKGNFNISNQEFVIATMSKISAIKEYTDKYREKDILAYYNANGTYKGNEEYLSKIEMEK